MEFRRSGASCRDSYAATEYDLVLDRRQEHFHRAPRSLVRAVIDAWAIEFAVRQSVSKRYLCGRFRGKVLNQDPQFPDGQLPPVQVEKINPAECEISF